MKNTVRPIELRDLPQLYDLCVAHAVYEQALLEPSGQIERWSLHFFSDHPLVFGLIAEQEGQVAGFLSYTLQYATWDAASYIYMDCLYLNDAFRSQGIGQLLMEALMEVAREKEIELIQWQTPEFNKGAIKFYHRLGATSKSKERFFLNVTPST